MERNSISRAQYESPNDNLDKPFTSNAKNKVLPSLVSPEKLNVKKIAHETEDFIKDFTVEEKIEWMHQKRLKANRLHNKKKYEESIYCYMEVLLATETIEGDIVLKKDDRLKHEIMIPSMLNLAASLKDTNQQMNALEICNRAIDLDPSYYKSFYRRGNVYQSMKEYEKALYPILLTFMMFREDYHQAKKNCNDEASNLMLKYTIEDLKTVQEKRKRAFRDLVEESSILNETNCEYSEIEEGESPDRQIEDENKILKYNDDLEELNKYGSFKYFVYPFKMLSKFFREKTGCCRRKKPDDDVPPNTA